MYKNVECIYNLTFAYKKKEKKYILEHLTLSITQFLQKDFVNFQNIRHLMKP